MEIEKVYIVVAQYRDSIYGMPMGFEIVGVASKRSTAKVIMNYHKDNNKEQNAMVYIWEEVIADNIQQWYNIKKLYKKEGGKDEI